MIFNKTIGLIGARGNSKRIPKKNLIEINKFPLIAYSILASRASKLIDKTIVYTEDSEIAEASFFFEADIPFMRPKELAEDNITDFQWISGFLAQYYKKFKEYPYYIAFLRPTTPLRELSVIESALTSVKEESTSLRSVERLPEAIEKTFKIKEDFFFYFRK